MNPEQLFEILFKFKYLPKKLPTGNSLKKLKAYLSQIITTNYYERRQLILGAGQISEYIYFVEKGLARAFYINHQTKKESTSILWNKHSIIAVPASFYRQMPSEVFIEVMADTKLISISYHQLMKCINEHPWAEIFLRDIILQHCAHETERIKELTFLSGWERYLRLLKIYPDIEQQVSKGIIASYLNIAPQSLSRMLKQKGHP